MSALTRGPLVNPLVALGLTTVGTSAVQALPANNLRQYLLLHNPATATTNVAFTLDGTTPVIAASGTITLIPGAMALFFDNFVPVGPVNVIGSAASTPVTILSAE